MEDLLAAAERGSVEATRLLGSKLRLWFHFCARDGAGSLLAGPIEEMRGEEKLEARS